MKEAAQAKKHKIDIQKVKAETQRKIIMSPSWVIPGLFYVLFSNLSPIMTVTLSNGPLI